MNTYSDVMAKHAADSASGKLTGSERMKIRVLRDIAGSRLLSVAARRDAERGLRAWEQRAKSKGWASLAQWEAAR